MPAYVPGKGEYEYECPEIEFKFKTFVSKTRSYGYID